jgi:hypothetical protein
VVISEYSAAMMTPLQMPANMGLESLLRFSKINNST